MLRFFKMACIGFSSQPKLTYISFIIHWQGNWHAEVGIRLLKDQSTDITIKFGIFRMKEMEIKHWNSLSFLRMNEGLLNKLIHKNHVFISLSTELICSGLQTQPPSHMLNIWGFFSLLLLFENMYMFPPWTRHIFYSLSCMLAVCPYFKRIKWFL